RLEAGCSGSFVSADGLVLTNHHCVNTCLAELSTGENDLMVKGFLAKTAAEERKCEAFEVSNLIGSTEVTGKIAAATRGLSGTAATQAREAEETRLEEECNKAAGSKDIQCEIVDLYHGGQFWLYRYRRYTEARLVFAPELSIANFGGDPDNFNFPRYDLDMAIGRVYDCGKPIKPEHYLHWSAKGAQDGEPVFVSGHPGNTSRLLTSDQLQTLRATVLPMRILIGAEERGRLIQFGKTGAEPYRVMLDPLLRVENGLKVRKGQLETLLTPSFVARQQAEETALRARVSASSNPEVRAASSAWDEISRAQVVSRAIYPRYRLLEQRQGFPGELFNAARRLVRASEERTKPNSERMREYTDAQLQTMEREMGSQAPIIPDLEEVELSFGLDKLREWLSPDDPLVKKVLGKQSTEEVAHAAVRGTKLADPAFRLGLWKGGKAAVEASGDPMIRLALLVEPESRAVYLRNKNEVEGVETAASEKISRARFLEEGTSVYPDATFTLRLTYGAVAGWTEGEKKIGPFTTLGGVFDRATGKEPFVLPPSWLSAQPRIAAGTTFNFTATTDIIGGNSGSLVVDRDGKLVGLAFDGNIHSIGGSFWFDPSQNRTVSVDSAGMLEAMKTVYGADRLVAELLGK